MQKLAVALGLSAAVLLAGGLAWNADAASWRSGTLNLPGLVKNYSPDRSDRLPWLGALSSGISLQVSAYLRMRCMACW
jgi:hypothetical protein